MIASSCATWKTPYRIYKPNKHTVFSPIEEIVDIKEHILTIDDRLTVQVTPNNAEQLLYPIEEERIGLGDELGGVYATALRHYSGYRIYPDSTVFMPGLGNRKLAGMTVTEAERYLVMEYSRLFNDPYVKITLFNKRALLYSGSRSGSVVTLVEPSTNLVEFLTMSGGVAMTGKAKIVYLFRKNDDAVTKIYKIDLSTSDNIKHGQIIIQSNDIVYVEPRVIVASRILEEFAPFLSLFTTTLLVISIFR
jgi:polysaccharide export outer membrane protein